MIWFTNINGKKLELEQTLVEYNNEPMLFTCTDSNNVRYLCTCFDICLGFKWAIVEIPDHILYQMQNGQISIYDAFCIENANKYIVKKRMPNYQESVQKVSGFQDEMLPEKQIYLF